MRCISIVTFALATKSSLSAPTGAASCVSSIPFSSNSPHLNIEPQLGDGTSFTDTGFKVSIGNAVLVPGEAFRTATNIDLPIKLTGEMKQFKGFLIRVSQGQMEEVGGDSDVQVAKVCTNAGVGGATHTFNDLKDSITATLKAFDKKTELLEMDVTVVTYLAKVDIDERTQGSEWYNARFILNVLPPLNPPPTTPTTPPPPTTSSPMPFPTTDSGASAQILMTQMGPMVMSVVAGLWFLA